MRKKLIAVFMFLVSFGVLADTPIDVSSLSYEEFDVFGSYWRQLGNEGKYMEAVELLDRFLQENDEGEEHRLLLFWHSGQMLAFAEKNIEAIERFKACYQDVDKSVPSSASYARQWNAYVDATIAFLEKQREELIRNRELIEAGPEGKMKKLNGAVVDRFIQHFDKSYKEAYSAPIEEK